MRPRIILGDLHHESWSLLKNLNHRVSLPWLCTRDFRETLDACGFASLGFVGNKFIWCKRLIGGRGNTVWERLDRAMINNEWSSLFPATKVIYLECSTSDYKLIIIHPIGIPIR